MTQTETVINPPPYINNNRLWSHFLSSFSAKNSPNSSFAYRRQQQTTGFVPTYLSTNKVLSTSSKFTLPGPLPCYSQNKIPSTWLRILAQKQFSAANKLPSWPVIILAPQKAFCMIRNHFSARSKLARPGEPIMRQQRCLHGPKH